MKKTLSLLLTVCMVVSVFLSALVTTKASELIDYKTDFIHALLSDESKWTSITGIRTKFFFMDLNFDDKEEFVVVIYGQGILVSSRIFTYQDSKVTEITDSESMLGLNVDNFTYYFNNVYDNYIITGYSVRKGSGGSYVGWQGNYDFEYDSNNNRIELNYFTSLTREYNYSDKTYTETYYDGSNGYNRANDFSGLHTITKSMYDNKNNEGMEHMTDAKFSYEAITLSDWNKKSSDNKRTALESSYNHFKYVHFRSLELGKNTNRFVHAASDIRITNPYYLAKLRLNSNQIDNIVVLMDLFKNSGYCFGISLSMCYAKNEDLDLDALNNGTKTANFWEIGGVTGNSKKNFRELMYYYYVYQHTNGGKPSEKVVNSEFMYSKSVNERLSEFLKKLVSEAITAQNQNLPFLFVFNYKENGNTEGHGVDIVGYYFNSEENRHELTIYDQNIYCDNDKSEDLRYYKLYINADFSGFEYNGKTDLNTTWTQLKYYSLEKIYNGIDKVSGGSAVGAEETTRLYITCGKPFRVEDSDGKYLSYDGGDFSGNIRVTDISIESMEDGASCLWNFTVPMSEKYIFTDMSGGLTVIGETTSGVFKINADSVDSFTTNGNEVAFSGSNYDFEVDFISSDDNFLSIGGNSDSHLVIKKNGGHVTLTPDGSMKKIYTKVYGFESSVIENIGNVSKPISIDLKTGKTADDAITGDVNLDGRITINDVTTIQYYLAEMADFTDEQRVSADTNGDGEISIADATRLQMYLAEYDVVLGKQS